MQRQSRKYSPTAPSPLLDCYSCLCTYKFTIFLSQIHPCIGVRRVCWSVFTPAKTSAEFAGAFSPLQKRPQSLLKHFHPCKSVRRVCWSKFTPAKTSAEFAEAFSPLQKRPQSLLEHFHPCKNVRRVCWSIFTPVKASAEPAETFFFLQLKKKAHKKNLLNAAPVLIIK